ncbi:MAG: helix-turn-helix domain-containing protein [Clostridia bacterium]|nr:helix-turn-helix domain-containing protein [Clostridia bacterium]
MNYYERVQNALDFIEDNLTEPIELEEIALKADMSLTNFYRLFYSIAGYTVKDYIRRRRLSHASMLLTNTNMRILDISLECQFESQEAFTRAFKQQLGCTPKVCRTGMNLFRFERIDIMDTYFEVQDKELIKKYPDIKVFKRLEPIKVAYYKAYSRTPENDAFAVLREWAERSKLHVGDTKYRIFGFDSPDSKPGDEIYGYEVWMTIDKDYAVNDDKVQSKLFEGGMYAVTSTFIKDIVTTWDRFREWLKVSKYGLGKHQYLEEHLPFSEWDRDKSQGEHKVDLYMPIADKEDKVPEQILPVQVVYCRVNGVEKKAPFEAWGIILDWANKSGLFKGQQHSFFTYHNYNIEKDKDKQWYEVMVTYDRNIENTDEKIKLKVFEGGDYITSKTIRKNLPKAWKDMLRWQDITKTKGGKHQWVEEWIVIDGSISMETDMKIYLPVQK